jgi:hypothetical protein
MYRLTCDIESVSKVVRKLGAVRNFRLSRVCYRDGSIQPILPHAVLPPLSQQYILELILSILPRKAYDSRPPSATALPHPHCLVPIPVPECFSVPDNGGNLRARDPFPPQWERCIPAYYLAATHRRRVHVWWSRLSSAGSATRREHIARAANILAVCGAHIDSGSGTCGHACTHVSSHFVVANVVQDELDLDGSRACVHHVIIILIARGRPSPPLRPAADGVAPSPELQRLICIQERKSPLACTCRGTTSTFYAHELDVNQQRDGPRRHPRTSKPSMPAAGRHLSSFLPRVASKRTQNVRLSVRLYGRLCRGRFRRTQIAGPRSPEFGQMRARSLGCFPRRMAGWKGILLLGLLCGLGHCGHLTSRLAGILPPMRLR